MTNLAEAASFFDVIDALDKTPEHDHHVLLPAEVGGGRAYVDKHGRYYRDNPFFGNVGEEHYGRIRGLEAKDNDRHGLHMGAAGLINLSYIAATKSKAAVLFDINPYQKMFWDILLDTIAQNPNRDEFIRAFVEAEKRIVEKIIIAERLSGNSSPCVGFIGETPLSDSHSPVRAELIWLSNDENYDHIHELAKAGKIATLTLDVCDDYSMARVREAFDNQTLSTLYLSNIFSFFEDGSDFTRREIQKDREPSVKKAKTTLDPLLSDRTLIISHTHIHTNRWQSQIGSNIVAGSRGNGREFFPFP